MVGYIAGLGTGAYTSYLDRGDKKLMAENRAESSDRRCFEDEVVMWNGEAHTICVPLDDIQQKYWDAAWNAAIECQYAGGQTMTWGCTTD